jgi:eukaryotic-like serine/threonine-protein kinase
MSDPVAVELYLRARAAYREFSPTGAAAASGLYDQALAIAPDDPALLAGKAMSLARISFFLGTRIPEAQETAARALALAPNSGEAHLATGTIHLQTGDIRAAFAEALAAIANSPSLGEAHQLAGRILAETGPADAALRALALAIEIEPRMGLSHMSLAQVLANTGRWDEAYATIEAARGAMSEQVTFHVASARMAAWNNDTERVKASVQALEQIAANSGGIRAEIARQFSVLVDPTAAKALLDNPGPLLSDGKHSVRRSLFILQALTEISASNGRLEGAMQHLESAVQTGLIDLLWFDGCPLLTPLRSDPRWVELRAPVLARAEAVRELLPHTQR